MVDGVIYIAGGFPARKEDGSLVFKYDTEKDQWSSLPPCPSEVFGLGHLSGKLIAAGGILRDRVTANVYSFHIDSNNWKEIPAMPTPRFRPTVISHRLAIGVCGGVGKTSISDKVEVLKNGSSRWCTVDPLPMPGCLMKPAIVGDTCYLMGGYSTWHPSTPTNHVMHSPVASLFTPSSSHSSNTSMWQLLPKDIPYNRSVAASLGGLLLAIGGWDEDEGTATDAVFAYSPAAPSWVQVGNLPSSRRAGGAITLPSGEVMVVGGIDHENHHINTVLLVSLIAH